MFFKKRLKFIIRVFNYLKFFLSYLFPSAIENLITIIINGDANAQKRVGRELVSINDLRPIKQFFRK